MKSGGENRQARVLKVREVRCVVATKKRCMLRRLVEIILQHTIRQCVCVRVFADTVGLGGEWRRLEEMEGARWRVEV